MKPSTNKASLNKAPQNKQPQLPGQVPDMQSGTIQDANTINKRKMMGGMLSQPPQMPGMMQPPGMPQPNDTYLHTPIRPNGPMGYNTMPPMPGMQQPGMPPMQQNFGMAPPMGGISPPGLPPGFAPMTGNTLAPPMNPMQQFGGMPGNPQLPPMMPPNLRRPGP